MNVKTSYEKNILKLMIEDDGVNTSQIEAAFYQKQDGVFVKEYQGEFLGADKIMQNFNRLMPSAFDEGEWENALLEFAKICKDNGIIMGAI